MSFYTGNLPAASNRADFLFGVQLIDANGTNDTVNFTTSLITIALRPVSGGGSSFPSGLAPSLTGTNQDGHITVLDPSQFMVHFTRQEMSQFGAGDLDMGITVRLADGNTYQLFSGQVPVIDGVVPL